ncbi:ankyrin repeat-containing domain, PGG domain protein [Tanacetum coccineum]
MTEPSLITRIVSICVLILPALFLDVFLFPCGLILIPIVMLVRVLYWKSISLVEPMKEKEEMDKAENVLELINISPEAIVSTDQSGYDIIQIAVINRSERIYNLIYDIGERKNLYRTIVDSSKNNILHLAGRLAPSRKLNKITGATLQLQQDLQWREEVKKVVFPTYITQENIFKETPAAITVPGGSNQDKGMPVFTKEVAFIIFAVSDTISLFAASTALLVFLSILTARFSEMDFLVRLPQDDSYCEFVPCCCHASSMIVASQRNCVLLLHLHSHSVVDSSRSTITYETNLAQEEDGKRARFNLGDNIPLSLVEALWMPLTMLVLNGSKSSSQGRASLSLLSLISFMDKFSSTNSFVLTSRSKSEYCSMDANNMKGICGATAFN